MSAIAIVYALFGDPAAAQAAARTMVEGRLAACANILAPCRSVYRWQGALEEAEETPVLFKTDPARRDALVAALGEIHGYEIPAISSWLAETSADYGGWVEGETRR